MSSERCIYLVRHGETTGESSIRYHGRNDVPLSELGREQIGNLIPLVQHVRFAAVIHSPLDRAVEAADILVAGLHREPARVEEAPDLIEVDFGEMEGLTKNEIAGRNPQWFATWESGQATGFPGGETFAGFEARVAAAVDGVLARHPEGHLLVVAHKGIIKRAVGHLLGLPGEAVAKLDPALGSLSVIAAGTEVQLKHWSLTPDGT